MNCNHIIGTADIDFDHLTLVNEGDSERGYCFNSFDPFQHCPKCGAPVAELAEAFRIRMDESMRVLRAELAARPKTPIDQAFQQLGESMMAKLREIDKSHSLQASLIMRKEPLPDGMGYNATQVHREEPDL